MEVGHPLDQLGDEAGELTGVAPKAPGGFGVFRHEVAQRLHEGLKGDAQVFVAAPGENERPLGMEPQSKLCGEAGLAHTHFAPYQDDPSLSPHHLVPGPLEALELFRPADEGELTPTGEERRDGNGRAGEGIPRHLAGGHRLR